MGENPETTLMVFRCPAVIVTQFRAAEPFQISLRGYWWPNTSTATENALCRSRTTQTYSRLTTTIELQLSKTFC